MPPRCTYPTSVSLSAVRDADRVALATGESKRLHVLAVGELQRQDAHSDQVGALDSLEALGAITTRTPWRSGPCAAQSREAPVPYSLPAITITMRAFGAVAFESLKDRQLDVWLDSAGLPCW